MSIEAGPGKNFVCQLMLPRRCIATCPSSTSSLLLHGSGSKLKCADTATLPGLERYDGLSCDYSGQVIDPGPRKRPIIELSTFFTNSSFDVMISDNMASQAVSRNGN